MKISKVRRKYYKVEDINGAQRTHGTTGQTEKCGNDWIESNAKGRTQQKGMCASGTGVMRGGPELSYSAAMRLE